MAQPAVALGGVRTKITRHPRNAAPRRRVPPRTQPGQSAHAGRSPVAPDPATTWHGAKGLGGAGRPCKDGVMSITETEDVLSTDATWRAAGEQVAVATV